MWFRITGPGAGIYAIGQVTSVPRQEATEFGNWQVDVTFGSRIDPPLLRAESDANPVLSATPALAGLMGANLSLPAEADAKLEELTEDRLIPVGGRKPAARLLEQKLNLDATSITRRVRTGPARAPARSASRAVRGTLRALPAHPGMRRRQGHRSRHGGFLGDGGMDVTGTLAQSGLPAVRLAVQAKRVTGGVGLSVVTQLRGSIPPGTYGIVITAGHFTRAAITEASRPDRNAIRLVDGPELAHVLAENGIGVKKTAIYVHRLDIEGLDDQLEAEQG